LCTLVECDPRRFSLLFRPRLFPFSFLGELSLGSMFEIKAGNSRQTTARVLFFPFPPYVPPFSVHPHYVEKTRPSDESPPVNSLLFPLCGSRSRSLLVKEPLFSFSFSCGAVLSENTIPPSRRRRITLLTPRSGRFFFSFPVLDGCFFFFFSSPSKTGI